jgi:subtilase family serine protease
MLSSRWARLTLVAATLLLMSVGLPTSVATTQPLPGLPSVTPGFARSAVKVADVNASTTIPFSVLVAGKQDDALPALARAVSDPFSPQFRQFLTRDEMLTRFDPAPATTALVVNGLRALGIQITRTSSDGRVVDAVAPAGVITAALGVQFAYMRAPNGKVERVALNEPVLPVALRPLVSDIIGLSATPVEHFADAPVDVSTAPPPAYFNARPCSSYYGQLSATTQPRYLGKAQPYAICGYTPDQIRAAYSVPQTGLDGRGVHIGIVDDYSSPTMVADTNTYSQRHGLPPLTAAQWVDHTDPAAAHTPEVVIADPTGIVGTVPVESPQDWSGEETLDVEMVHVMAPAATIEYYGGDQGLGLQPLEAEFAQVIADDTVQFVSDSWGLFEQDVLLTPADSQFMVTMLGIGATEGIGASFSSGDDGDNVESWDVKAADFPASTDLATAVGGTTLVVGRNNTYVGETYWGTRAEPKTADGKGWDGAPTSKGVGPATGPGTLAGAGGGGVSALFAEPSWQVGVVPASLTTQTYTSPDGSSTNNVTSPGRVVPDISLVGDSTTGVLIGQTQTDVNGQAAYSEFRIGGTSVSSPLFAGIVALAIQLNGGNPLGFVSPAMYAAYPKSPKAFRDPSLGRTLVNVRPDYTNPQDPTTALVYHLRVLGQLSTLHDLKGYDDSTGLGSPCASALVKALLRPLVATGSTPGCTR